MVYLPCKRQCLHLYSKTGIYTGTTFLVYDRMQHFALARLRLAHACTHVYVSAKHHTIRHPTQHVEHDDLDHTQQTQRRSQRPQPTSTIRHATPRRSAHGVSAKCGRRSTLAGTVRAAGGLQGGARRLQRAAGLGRRPAARELGRGAAMVQEAPCRKSHVS